jgi:hypothetical protein
MATTCQRVSNCADNDVRPAGFAVEATHHEHNSWICARAATHQMNSRLRIRSMVLACRTAA